MNRIIETYSPQRMEQIRKLLETQIQKGLPVQYEIFVDNFKVVPKTNDIEEFDSYDDYLSSTTRSIKLLFYNSDSGKEEVNEYVFKMSLYFSNQGNSQNTELSGLDIEDKISQQVQSRIDKYQHDKDLADTKQQLLEAKTYISELEAELEQEQHKKGLETIKWGEIGSVVLENIIKRNPQLLTVLPGGDALAGVLMQPNEPIQTTNKSSEPESEMTFKEKKSTSTLSEKERAFHQVFEAFEQRFDAQGLETVNFILHAMLKNPSVVTQIADLLKDDLTGNEH